jgi:hypothetical protein
MMDAIQFAGGTLSIRRPKDYLPVPGRADKVHNNTHRKNQKDERATTM